MMEGHQRIKMLLLLALSLDLALGASLGSSGDRYGPKFEYGGRDDGHHHVTFNYGSDGVYKFSFKLPEQSRYEERNEEGEVRGSYSFVDPEGEEFSLQYLADKGGFQPVADHLPVAPEETEDVKEARKAFAEFYEETVKYLEALSSKEGSDDAPGRRYQAPAGSYQAPRLGDIDGDDDDDDEDTSSESEEDEEDSSEEDGEDDEEDSSEEDGEDDDEDEEEEKEGRRGDRDGRRSGKKDEDEDEEEEEQRGGKRGDRDGRRSGKKDDEEEEEEGGDEEKEEEKKSSNRREGGRNNRNDSKQSRSGRGSDKRKQ